MRTAVNYKLKSLVLREAKKNPYLGVRQIAALLNQKHKITISKSTVDNIIRAKGIKAKRGRKLQALLYQRKEIKDCGLFLLKALDSQAGLFDVLTGELQLYFPRLNAEWLKKIITLAAFSGYLAGSIETNAKRSGFLRLADMAYYPSRKVKYFIGRLSGYKPAVSLDKVKRNLQAVSTIKFYFANNQTGFCDAQMTAFWDSPCVLSNFFAAFYRVRERVLTMLKNKLIMVGYTKSFDSLSPLVVSFVEGLSSGIKKIELLGADDKVLETLPCEMLKPSFLIGYYPKIFAKGMIFLEREKRFKKLTVLEEFFYTSVLTRFSQAKTNKGIILNNILIKFKEKSLPSWGFITDKRTTFSGFLEKYLLLWPYPEKTFLDDIKLIEKSFFTKEERKDLPGLIPAGVSFENTGDSAKAAEILASLFREQAGNFELKALSGELVIGKNSCQAVLKGMPGSIKQKFNNLCLYLGDKRVFLT